ncbi:acetyltransferase [Bacillus cereus group sp. TH260-2LC]|uniref:acetyltransferase n=1 Tax=unclassified Bacillus cereus group TaxID=2750818 RepID=UPI0022E0A62F|nr:acetyltransferase [Bacillus cereus group sp. TH260-2LC]MDA1529870.1 acetyltransferase [Bacillus cereus group sp. TH260-2LC]
MKKIALVGQGGHAKVITDILHANIGYKIVAVFDDKYEGLVEEQGIYYGPVSSIKETIEEIGFKLVISIGNNTVRKKIVKQLALKETNYETIIHPTAVVSESASIGFGTVIMPKAVINAETIIGNHVIVNTAAVIEHDNQIGDFAHISPNATLTGTIYVDEGTQIGAGAIVIPNRKIGEWSIIGAGATVIHDIPSNCTAVGLPAKVIK